ncbi:MAG: hypothetical protein ACXVP5_00750 [Tumebacillaceae bacterium]
MQPLLFGIGVFVLAGALFYVFAWASRISTKPDEQKVRENG